MTGDAAKLWGGRFTGKTDAQMDSFNASIGFDRRLFDVDIHGSLAYSEALCGAKLITEQERDKMHDGLRQVLVEWENGTFVIKEGDEDIHTANERRLGEIIGKDIAGKLHTGRSRNDQVATDMRLWARREAGKLQQKLRAIIKVLVTRAETEIDVLMPGYTHLQRAQPIRWSHLLLSYAWLFHSDACRLASLLLSSDAHSMSLPLGSGALAGNPFGVDRHMLAKGLGFEAVTPNSLFGVGDRDFIADFLYACTMIMIHLSRLSEDFINYSSSEFGFIKLADAYSTGSSLMPQKKNPDSLELIRGKSGRVFGNLTGFLMTYKSLPSTYNKDLQEDKEPLFDSVDSVSACLEITSRVIETLSINATAMSSALSLEMLATDVAEYLVRKGVPFRQAHHHAGALVLYSEQNQCKMNDIPFKVYQSISPAFEKDITNSEWWNYERSVESRDAVGGTNKQRVLEQIEDLKLWLH